MEVLAYLFTVIIVVVIFQFPYAVPMEGYKNKFIMVDSRNALIDERKQNNFFRIRTKLDEQGNVVSALYGRTIYFEYWMTGSLLHFYFGLNLTPNDRNLEWDGQTNLLKK